MQQLIHCTQAHSNVLHRYKMSGFHYVSFQTNPGSRAASHPIERGEVGAASEQSTEGSSLQTSNGMYVCMYVHWTVSTHCGAFVYIDSYVLQWDLSIKDTLGPANLSTVERLSTLQK